MESIDLRKKYSGEVVWETFTNGVGKAFVKAVHYPSGIFVTMDDIPEDSGIFNKHGYVKSSIILNEVVLGILDGKIQKYNEDRVDRDINTDGDRDINGDIKYITNGRK